MAKPSWRDSAACANLPRKEGKEPVNFFSDDTSEKYDARAVCMNTCPVRKECLEFALTNKQIWGIWGGVDEYELRRALSVNRIGEPIRRARAPRCPYCSRQTLETKIKKRARFFVECSVCELSWWIWRAPRATPIHDAGTIET